MKRRLIIIYTTALLLVVICFFNCNKSNPISPKIEDSSVVKFHFTNIPTQVAKIAVNLSREGFLTLSQVVTVTGQNAFCQFSDVASGTWHIKADAKNEADSVLYTGETNVTVIAGQTVTVYLELKAVGDIDIYITWEQEEIYTFIYDFNDGNLTGWNGPANAEIYQNMLHLWSAIGFKWHTISNVSTTHFSKGMIEFEIQPLGGAYTFETKGASRSNSVQNWGVYMRWLADSLYVQAYENNNPVLINTQLTYQPDDWYHIKINFDGQQGSKGRFSFWMKNITRGGEYKYGGEYDYYAQYGPLVGVNLISLGVYDTQNPRVLEKHVYFDNIYFNVLL